MLCQMNEPFLPTYDFDNIPTDDELALENKYTAPLPFIPAPKSISDDDFIKMLKDVQEAQVKTAPPGSLESAIKKFLPDAAGWPMPKANKFLDPMGYLAEQLNSSQEKTTELRVPKEFKGELGSYDGMRFIGMDPGKDEGSYVAFLHPMTEAELRGAANKDNPYGLSVNYDPVTDCYIFNDKYEVLGEDYLLAVKRGMTDLEIFNLCIGVKA